MCNNGRNHIASSQYTSMFVALLHPLLHLHKSATTVQLNVALLHPLLHPATLSATTDKCRRTLSLEATCTYMLHMLHTCTLREFLKIFCKLSLLTHGMLAV